MVSTVVLKFVCGLLLIIVLAITINELGYSLDKHTAAIVSVAKETPPEHNATSGSGVVEIPKQVACIPPPLMVPTKQNTKPDHKRKLKHLEVNNQRQNETQYAMIEEESPAIPDIASAPITTSNTWQHH